MARANRHPHRAGRSASAPAPAEGDALPPWIGGVDTAKARSSRRGPPPQSSSQRSPPREDAPAAMLIADYGPARSGIGDTLQAVRRHRFADPLAAQGKTDLTAHVDFAALNETARGPGSPRSAPCRKGSSCSSSGLRRAWIVSAATRRPSRGSDPFGRGAACRSTPNGGALQDARAAIERACPAASFGDI